MSRFISNICPVCCNRSLVTKSYIRKKDKAECVVHYCTTENCGYRNLVKENIPTVKAGEYHIVNKQYGFNF